MPYIALIAIGTLLLLELSGSIPLSSVGGPMTIALVIFATALAVGIREAWINKRGILGWIASILVSLVGAYIAAEIGNLLIGAVFLLVSPEGSLAETRHPLLYIWMIVTVLLTMTGSWLALRLVDRLR
jgi:hypothetical protein